MDYRIKVPTSVRLFVFDWDGTILDSKEATLSAYEKVFVEAGISLDRQKLLAHYSPNWYTTYRALGLPDELYSWADHRWLEIFVKSERSLIKGAAEMLRGLQDRGYSLALLTAAARERIYLELEEFELRHLFRQVVTMEDFRARKPDPTPLLHILSSFAVDSMEVVSVGDTAEDIEMGKRAGTLTVAVLGPYVQRKALLNARPTFFVEQLSQILNLIPDSSSK